MERLLTDEALRLRFTLDPIGTLGELHDTGSSSLRTRLICSSSQTSECGFGSTVASAIGLTDDRLNTAHVAIHMPAWCVQLNR